jgi:type II secretory pathway pseudopilin PulG
VIARLRRPKGEEGFTLVELLVSSVMGVIVMGAVASLVISAVREQPKISKEVQNVSDARWMLERLTHELRNGKEVKEGTASKISFVGYVRRTTCGGSTALTASSPAIECRITYECSTTACTRKETVPGVSTGGVAKQTFRGLASNQVFSYIPEKSPVTQVTYVKVTLQLPDPTDAGSPLVISSGASLRNATLGY